MKIKPFFVFDYFVKKGKGPIFCPMKFHFLPGIILSLEEEGCSEFKWINSI